MAVAGGWYTRVRRRDGGGGRTVVEDAHGAGMGLAGEAALGIVQDLCDDGVVARELDLRDVERAGLLDIRSILEDLGSV